ncbi:MULTISPECIES: hypothetical protein [Salipiger]|uniref:Uncharacterized protein n=1 Tax=Salipiger profundus TaxID=1229727 RepID=A0A1U7DDS0_9RHOB|nr:MULTISPECIES: hypothetical protein [Salipiger]APX26314.1 hypothetical protein Ga0080559_TMP5214 [Salipiger profundus]GGA21553.1 hypothetical protein GCM10011326_37690 [Salipiger profundus]
MLSKMITGLTASLVLVGASGAESAGDASAASARALRAAAIAAVEAEDADALLAIMQEMQRRSMYFFEGDEVLCRREPPKVGLLAKPGFNFGTARTAYQTFNKVQRLEEQTCTCPQAARSFEEFSVEFLGVMPEDISETEMQKLREYNIANKNTVYAEYRDFRNQTCREAP